MLQQLKLLNQICYVYFAYSIFNGAYILMLDLKKGVTGVLYWCMNERDWPEDWRHFIDRAEGTPCKWMGSSAQCKGCRGRRKISVTISGVRTMRPNSGKKEDKE